MASMRNTLLLMLVIAINFLSGCSSTKPIPDLTSNKEVVDAKELTLWQLQGKLAFKSKEEKFSANLNWYQQHQDMTVNLLSFLGTSLFKLSTSPKQSILEVDGQVYESFDAEHLLYSTTGRRIPVHQLSKLVKGVVPAGMKAQTDEHGQLLRVEFKDSLNTRWLITYQEFKTFKQLRLPTKLKLASDTETIKIQIKQWNF